MSLGQQGFHIEKDCQVRNTDTYGLDPVHPLPNLDVVDINAVKRGGGSDLVIVIAAPLQGDVRSLERLRRKIERYLEFTKAPEFRRGGGVATATEH